MVAQLLWQVPEKRMSQHIGDSTKVGQTCKPGLQVTPSGRVRIGT